tara:strand:+ start:6928 stop:7260 length:333 start_codon:yes stop_codon:yes gene_type:complete
MHEINIEDFMKIDLRVARIKKAEEIEEANKLLKLELDLGQLGTKTVFAGIKLFYNPEVLINRMVICVNNLESRKMRFGISEGMILASGDDETGIFILSPDKGAEPGMKVR